MSKTYDIAIRFHSVSNLPVADLGKFSSDPYLKIKLGVSTKKTTESGWHPVKETPGPDPDDPVIVFRTPTHHQTLNPIFPPQTFWVVSNIPESGFSMTVICRDEDPSNSDDGLGKTKIEIEGVTGAGWKKEHMKIELKRRNGGGSWRAFAFSPVINAINGQKISSGRPVVDMSIEVIGETEDNAGRQFPYTSGPAYFSKHFSPFAGRMAGIVEKSDPEASNQGDRPLFGGKKYNFQANVLQLQGPVPPELNHPFVPSKFFIKKLFTGKVLPHALHAHHRSIFSHDLKTVYGVIIQDKREMTILEESAASSGISLEEIALSPSRRPSSPPRADDEKRSKLKRILKGGKVEGDPEFKAMELENPRPTEEQPYGNPNLDKSQRFLEMCGELLESGKVKKQADVGEDGEEEEQTGGALYTYVVTTDGQMRWSEVGTGWASEVGSKHVILSNGAKHVAFAGEFFIRRKPKRYRRRPSYANTSRSGSSSSNIVTYRNSKNRDDRKKKQPGSQSQNSSSPPKEGMLGDTLPVADRTADVWFQPTTLSSHLRTDSANTVDLDRDLELMFPTSLSQTLSQTSLNTSDQVRFQLYIDNDSGTYRPPDTHIPEFREFMKRQFPGFDVIVTHCAGEAGKKIEKMKQAHVRKGRERGEVAGDPGDAVEGGDLVFSDSSSSSSSDDEHDGGYADRSGINKGGKLPNGVQEFAEKYGIRLM
ncbi:hypothetical protein H072_4494 [Dactylellina haptotyla CBS 200.50]|uniref:C2 domain-containing protein n=1 Tax=Dactylellina haptotyla (strain CBS 200.50) TaxID=1284197 RepID=S8AEZ6_DACHA|nr:hypothetical protein H072_4494 [Dactylellina haptotyla CBS 200.50]